MAVTQSMVLGGNYKEIVVQVKRSNGRYDNFTIHKITLTARGPTVIVQDIAARRAEGGPLSQLLSWNPGLQEALSLKDYHLDTSHTDEYKAKIIHRFTCWLLHRC